MMKERTAEREFESDFVTRNSLFEIRSSNV